MNHSPLSDHLKDSHLSEEYLYVHHVIRLSKYQIIQNFHKNVLMNKYQKVLIEAAQMSSCGIIV